MLRISRRTLAAATALSVSAVLLAACGTTEEAADSPAASSAPSTGPVDLTDERGPVHLDKPATKVVSLEWGLTENLVSLGVQPVGAADIKNYNIWDTTAPLAASVKDVGTRDAPSLDAIVALDPDLVVTTVDLSKDVIAQIQKQVPVIALKGSDGTDPIAYLRKTVNTLAAATGTQAQATTLLAGFDAKVADGKQKLAAAGKAGAPFTMADGWIDSGTVNVRMYTPTSFLGAVAAQLGLTNQYTTGGDKDYGLAQTDIEGLTKITDGKTTFLYTASDDADSQAWVKALTGNAVWKQLPFVKTGAVKQVTPGIWMFGGTASANAYVDALVQAVGGA